MPVLFGVGKSPCHWLDLDSDSPESILVSHRPEAMESWQIIMLDYSGPSCSQMASSTLCLPP